MSLVVLDFLGGAPEAFLFETILVSMTQFSNCYSFSAPTLSPKDLPARANKSLAAAEHLWAVLIYTVELYDDEAGTQVRVAPCVPSDERWWSLREREHEKRCSVSDFIFHLYFCLFCLLVSFCPNLPPSTSAFQDPGGSLSPAASVSKPHCLLCPGVGRP